MNIKMVRGDSSLKKYADDIVNMIHVEAGKNKMLEWDADTLALSITSGNSILAFADNEVVGHVCLVFWSSYVEICALIVHENVRGRGVGTRLMEEAVNISRQMTKKQVILLPNETSYPIGERIGFSGRSKQYFGSEIWESCSACHEKENFPKCHCQPMVLDKIGDAKFVALHDSDEQLILETAQTYCGIWKEPPWSEDFWEVPCVVSDIKEQMQKEFASFVVAQVGNSIAGFTWGYGIDQVGMRALCGSMALDFLFDECANVFYVDELATASLFRRKGIGLQLAQVLLGEARALGMSVLCLRTDINAQAARNLYGMLGFVDLGIQDEKYPNRTYWVMK